jgi:hypothetical protein
VVDGCGAGKGVRPPVRPHMIQLPSGCPHFGAWMRLPFCILNILGDVLDDGELYFVEAAQTLDAAKARVQSLSEVLPGEYVIYDEATGERVLITATSPASEETLGH